MTGTDGVEHIARMVPNDVPLFGSERVLLPGDALKLQSVPVGIIPPAPNHLNNQLQFAIGPGDYQFDCEVDFPGYTATDGQGKQVVPAEGEWTGKLSTTKFAVTVLPTINPRKWMRIDIDADGAIRMDREPATLDEVGAAAAKSPEWKIVIEADDDVPHAQVAQLADTLNAAGAEFAYRDGRMGDAKLRVAKLQANYDFEGERTFSMCRPGEQHPHWFTIGFPADGDTPRSVLRFFPNTSESTRSHWAAAWEPGTDIIWWIDDSDIGKLRISDPKNIIVTREGRTNHFSRDFALPENVKEEFRRLGFVVGREQREGLPILGGNTGSQEILVAVARDVWIVAGSVTDADGKPLADVPVKARGEASENEMGTDSIFKSNLRCLRRRRPLN